jgi:multidrug efflux pump
MNFTEFFIRRPAFTIVVTLIITIFGIISFSKLPLRWIPNVNPPVITINTIYNGASANLMETEITTPLEAALSSIEGVESMTSRSKVGNSSITLTFKLGRNLDSAMEDVRSSINSAMATLPRDINAPEVSKAEMDDMPILFFAFSDTHRSAKEVSDYIDQFILPRLQTIDGVANVISYGKEVSALRIWLDPAKMAASKIVVDDITPVLTQQNIEIPSGQIRGADRFYNVVTNETLSSANQFNDLIIRNENNQVTRLKDIAQIVVAPANTDSAFRANGQPAVAVGIIPQSTANPLMVAQQVLTTFTDIKKSLPTTMQAHVVYNAADFIRESVNSVYEALAEAIFFVLIVIYLSLANWRATLIPVITIPVCLLTSLAFLHIFKLSLNTITLMAFVLAIGLVVDDAIVMLENIMRYVEFGMKPFAAALKGSREMVVPVIAMTLTLAAVYIPIIFTNGIMGAIFYEFALTLAAAVLVSGFVALTLSPMMCARILKKDAVSNRYATWLAAQQIILQEKYRLLLSRVLQKRNMVLIILIVIGITGYGIYRSLPSELAPTEDRNEIDAFVSGPHDASFQYTDSYIKKLEAIYASIPEMTSYIAGIGIGGSPADSFQIINLKPRSERNRSAQAIADELNARVSQFAGVRAYIQVPPSPLVNLSSNSGNNVAMSVMTAGEFKDLNVSMQALMLAAKKTGIFQRVDNTLKWDRDQFEINIDREKTADLHVNMAAVTNTISILLAGKNSGKFVYGGKQYDVILQMNPLSLANPNIISELSVRNNNDTMVPLADLITSQETTAPGSLPHYSRLRADRFSASLAPGRTIADAIKTLEKISRQVLPDNMKTAFMGEAMAYQESNGTMSTTFLLALIFIYLILVAQFESFIDPLVILFTVPFAVIGALLTLWLAGGTLNIYSYIGLVTLIGLIAKHGILITEFASHARARGNSIEYAIVEAATLRLRPIIMTTSAMVLGALPLALASGPGSETRHQVGWVIVGGMLIGTFFSLIVVPVAYTYLAKFKKTPLPVMEDVFETELTE